MAFTVILILVLFVQSNPYPTSKNNVIESLHKGIIVLPNHVIRQNKHAIDYRVRFYSSTISTVVTRMNVYIIKVSETSKCFIKFYNNIFLNIFFVSILFFCYLLFTPVNAHYNSY